jgi:hypothetical protein
MSEDQFDQLREDGLERTSLEACLAQVRKHRLRLPQKRKRTVCAYGGGVGWGRGMGTPKARSLASACLHTCHFLITLAQLRNS